MESISVREFRSNLKAYLERIKSGEVFEVGEVRLSVYTEVSERVHRSVELIEIVCTRCDKCKKDAECRKWTEDGMDYKICAICALKSKLPWHKLEKLTL